VLDISRIETGTMRVSLEPVEVMSALGDAVALVTPVAEQAGITIGIELLSDAECHVLADRQRLRQVVLNLLSNAVKYSRPGDAVTVSYASSADRVQITVADTGPGIDPAKLDRLFVAFDRLDAEDSGVQGTGLGLALSRSLVELMGGTIDAHSSPGEGSAFTVELTAAPSPVTVARLAAAREVGTLANILGTRTILYIEDNPSNARLIQHTFAGQPDVKLIQAIQGSTGLELAKAHQPDLILLDLHLPDMHGSVVLDRLQADPATAAIPVIILSADATDRQVRALREAGARAYLTKPLDLPEFLAVVTAHLPVQVSA
jgi:CheY-like chemotaxis protein